MSIAASIKGIHADMADMSRHAQKLVSFWPCDGSKAEDLCSYVTALDRAAGDMEVASFDALRALVEDSRRLLGLLRALVVDMGHEIPAAAERCTGVMQCCMGVASYLSDIMIEAGAAMRGCMPVKQAQAPVEETPLFARVVAPETDPLRLLQSLHRAGDHTMDPNPDR